MCLERGLIPPLTHCVRTATANKLTLNDFSPCQPYLIVQQGVVSPFKSIRNPANGIAIALFRVLSFSRAAPYPGFSPWHLNAVH
jgi:hypothetical protein